MVSLRESSLTMVPTSRTQWSLNYARSSRSSITTLLHTDEWHDGSHQQEYKEDCAKYGGDLQILAWDVTIFSSWLSYLNANINWGNPIISSILYGNCPACQSPNSFSKNHERCRLRQRRMDSYKVGSAEFDWQKEVGCCLSWPDVQKTYDQGIQ